jgi:capsular polysaccharide biosynthesis protein
MLLKKKFKFFYKKLIINIFFAIYGKIKVQKKIQKEIKVTSIYKIFKSNIKKYKYRLYQINNGRVFTNYVENLAVISKNILMRDVSFQQIKGHLKQNRNEVLLNGTPKFKKKINGRMVVLTQGASGHFNYAHWLFDIIPKIILISQHYKIDKKDFFYFSRLNKFQKETLKLMNINIDTKKFIDSNKFRHVEAEKLLAVTHPNYFNKTFFFSHSNLPVWIILSLKKIFQKKILKKSNYKKIFIDRTDSNQNHCKLTNNKEVITFLRKKNFKILKLSNLKFIDQVSIFSNCKMIIAPHGAGLANIAFCSFNTKVVEIIPKYIKNYEYKRVSKINKLNHQFIFLNEIKNNNDGDMYLDLDKIRKII